MHHARLTYMIQFLLRAGQQAQAAAITLNAYEPGSSMSHKREVDFAAQVAEEVAHVLKDSAACELVANGQRSQVASQIPERVPGGAYGQAVDDAAKAVLERLYDEASEGILVTFSRDAVAARVAEQARSTGINCRNAGDAVCMSMQDWAVMPARLNDEADKDRIFEMLDRQIPADPSRMVNQLVKGY